MAVETDYTKYARCRKCNALVSREAKRCKACGTRVSRWSGVKDLALFSVVVVLLYIAYQNRHLIIG